MPPPPRRWCCTKWCARVPRGREEPMRIRSITLFADLSYPLDEDALLTYGQFLASAREAYEAAGYVVQSTRLASQPFPQILGPGYADQAVLLAMEIEALAGAHGID